MPHHAQCIALMALIFELLGGSLGLISHLTVYCLHANRHISHMYPRVRLLLVLELPLVSLTFYSFKYPPYAEFQARYAVHIIYAFALRPIDSLILVDLAHDFWRSSVRRLCDCDFALHAAYQTSDRLQAVRSPVWPCYMLTHIHLPRTDHLIRDLVLYSISTCALTRYVFADATHARMFAKLTVVLLVSLAFFPYGPLPDRSPS